MAETVRTTKSIVWYLLGKEGHGFWKKSNWNFQMNATGRFLEKICLYKQVGKCYRQAKNNMSETVFFTIPDTF
jgi:hypothetical protein